MAQQAEALANGTATPRANPSGTVSNAEPDPDKAWGTEKVFT